MPRKLIAPSAGETLVSNVRIYQGGTDGDTAAEARANLGLLDVTLKDQANGYAGLDSNGKILSSIIPNSAIANQTTVEQILGNVDPAYSISYGTVQYRITNFDVNTNYTLTTSLGTITRDNDLVTWTVGTLDGQADLVIGNKSFSAQVLQQAASAPTVITPFNTIYSRAIDMPISGIMRGTAFVHADPSKSLVSRHWQISETANFLTTVFDETVSTGDLLEVEYSGLEVGKTYYIRAQDYDGQWWSAYSSVVTAFTKGVIPTLRAQELDSFLTHDYEISKFGYNCATISGDGQHAIVGNTTNTLTSNANEGSAFYFKKIGRSWIYQCMLPLPRSEADLKFGLNAKLNHDGSALLVSAGEYIDHTKKGSVFFYKREGNSWTYITEIQPVDGHVADNFGYSIGGNADLSTVVIGAPANSSGKGAFYVYSRNVNAFTQVSKITNTSLGNAFSKGVAMSGDGQYIYTYAPNTGSQVIHLYTLVSGNWTYQNPVTDLTIPQMTNMVVSEDGKSLMVFFSLGYSHLYRHTQSDWELAYRYADGHLFPSPGNQFGRIGALNADGTVLLLGTTDVSTGIGRVFSYEVPVRPYDRLDWATSVPTAALSVNRGDLAISASDSILIAGDHDVVNTSSITGRFLYIKKLNNVWTNVGYVYNPETVQQPGVNNLFGSDISISGDGIHMLVTDKGYNAVYYFRRSGDTWTFINKLTISGLVNVSSAEISHNGNYALVGDIGYNSNEGAVRWLSRSGNTWSVVSTFSAPNAETKLGKDIVMTKDNTLAVVSAEGANAQGALHIFAYVNSAWTHISRQESSDSADNLLFGEKIALAKDDKTLYITQGGPVGLGADAVVVKTAYLYYNTIKEIANTKSDLGFDKAPTGLAVSTDASKLFGLYAGVSSIIMADVSMYKDIQVQFKPQKEYNVASPSVNATNYGATVSLSGDGKHMLVGATEHTDGANTATGIVYYYQKSALGQWTFVGTINNPAHRTDARFGAGIGMSKDGTHAIIGATGALVSGNVTGRAYYYTRSGGSWTNQSSFAGIDLSDNSEFGCSVSLNDEGTYAVIGAYVASEGATNSGVAYTFTRSGLSWLQSVKILDPTPTTVGYFGYSVSVSGNASGLLGLVISKHRDTFKGTANGSVYYYAYEGTVWVLKSKITAPNKATNNTEFGRTVALNSDNTKLIVKSTTFYGAAASQQCYTMFERVGSKWFARDMFKPFVDTTDTFPYGRFGVSSSFNDFVIGEPGYLSGVGRIIHHKGLYAGVTNNYSISNARTFNAENSFQRLTPPSAVSGDKFGASISTSKDGSLVFVGSPGKTSGTAGCGVWHFYRKSEDGLLSLVNTNELGTKYTNDNLGRSIACDDNGARILVGRPGLNNPSYPGGSVSHYTRSGDTFTLVNTFTASGAASDDRFGTGMAMSKDGLHALVGSPGQDSAASNSGRVYYFTRTGDTWSQQNYFDCPDAVTGVEFGYSIAMSADGSKALVAAYTNSTGSGALTFSGTVYYYTRNVNTWTYVGKFYSHAPATNGMFGSGLAMNADGTKAYIGSSGAANNLSRAIRYYELQADLWTYVSESLNTESGSTSYGKALAVNSQFTWLYAGHDTDVNTVDAGVVYAYTNKRESVSKLSRVKYIPNRANAVSDTDERSILVYNTPDYDLGLNNISMYGIRLSISNDKVHLFVSEYYNNNSYGKVCYYQLIDGKYRYINKIATPRPFFNGSFGFDMSISGNGQHALFGETGNNEITGLTNGMVYYYRRDGNTWNFINKFYPVGVVSGERFGYALAVSNAGTKALIAVIGKDQGDTVDAGAVHYYTRSGDTWTLQQTIQPPNLDSDAYFGYTLDMSPDGTKALIIATSTQHTYNVSEAHYYSLVNNVWVRQSVSKFDRVVNTDFPASSIALNGVGDFAVLALRPRCQLVTMSRIGTDFNETGRLATANRPQSVEISDLADEIYYGCNASPSGAAISDYQKRIRIYR